MIDSKRILNLRDQFYLHCANRECKMPFQIKQTLYYTTKILKDASGTNIGSLMRELTQLHKLQQANLEIKILFHNISIGPVSQFAKHIYSILSNSPNYKKDLIEYINANRRFSIDAITKRSITLLYFIKQMLKVSKREKATALLYAELFNRMKIYDEQLVDLLLTQYSRHLLIIIRKFTTLLDSKSDLFLENKEVQNDRYKELRRYTRFIGKLTNEYKNGWCIGVGWMQNIFKMLNGNQTDKYLLEACVKLHNAIRLTLQDSTSGSHQISEFQMEFLRIYYFDLLTKLDGDDAFIYIPTHIYDLFKRRIKQNNDNTW